ncbi:MAG: histidine phosphatase family protein [Betaproteobacteria bacterium]
MTPRKIVLLRHADEPNDPVHPDDPDLSAAGRARAEKLARYIPKMCGRPDFVLAAAPNRTSVRAFLTMRPLCDALGPRLDASIKSNKSDALAVTLLTEPVFEGKLILICWTHTELPILAEALKAPRGEYPDPWEEAVYDLLLELSYGRRGKPSVKSITQPF